MADISSRAGCSNPPSQLSKIISICSIFAFSMVLNVFQNCVRASDLKNASKVNGSQEQGELESNKPKLATAKHLFEEGRYKPASVLLKEVLASDSTSSEGNLLMGKIALLDGQPKAALDYFRNGVKAGPANFRYVEPVAQACLDSGTPDNIARAYRAGKAEFYIIPSVNFACVYAQAALETKHPEICIKVVDSLLSWQVFKPKPDEKARLHYLKSCALKLTGQKDKALQEEKISLDSDPAVVKKTKLVMLSEVAEKSR